MTKKLGCGPLAALLIVIFVVVFMGANEGVGYYFSNCEDENIFDCMMKDEEEPEPEGAVVASGVYTYKGYDVTITFNVPLAGGTVTGSVSGTCEGTVKGTFGGQNGGAISGRMSGVCAPFFVNIPSSAEFSGTVNKTGKTVPISFTGKGGGITHEGSMTLVYP